MTPVALAASCYACLHVGEVWQGISCRRQRAKVPLSTLVLLNERMGEDMHDNTNDAEIEILVGELAVD